MYGCESRNAEKTPRTSWLNHNCDRLLNRLLQIAHEGYSIRCCNAAAGVDNGSWVAGLGSARIYSGVVAVRTPWNESPFKLRIIFRHLYWVWSSFCLCIEPIICDTDFSYVFFFFFAFSFFLATQPKPFKVIQGQRLYHIQKPPIGKFLIACMPWHSI